VKDIDMSTVGGRIRELRRKYGMTQEELADKMFVSAKTIYGPNPDYEVNGW
jgi:DNA-binding XRE family transcriptional regulator